MLNDFGFFIVKNQKVVSVGGYVAQNVIRGVQDLLDTLGDDVNTMDIAEMINNAGASVERVDVEGYGDGYYTVYIKYYREMFCPKLKKWVYADCQRCQYDFANCEYYHVAKVVW